MAYDKIITLHRRMDHCVNYVLNEEKTGLNGALAYAENPEKSHRLVTGINCDPATAHAEMQATKRRWDKTGGVVGYHIIHSYAPGETTPEEAHAAGVEFARRLLGDRFEAVVATHTDREHLHCHIVFNSVSFMDGGKYRSDFESYFETLRGTSNEVSREYGLSVIEPSGRGKHYAEWDAERRGKATVTSLVKQDIDAAIAESFTFDSFLAALRRQGYTVKYGENVKHTAVRPPGGERFFRLDTLKGEYTEARIRARLAGIRTGEAPPPVPFTSVPSVTRPPRRYTVRHGQLRQPRRKLRGFRALYVHYLYLLGGRRPRNRRPIPFSIRKEVLKLERYQRQFRFLRAYRIDTDAQLSMLGEALQARIDALVEERKGLYRQKRAGRDMEADIGHINQELRRLRRELKTCGQITADLPRIRGQAQLYRERREQEEHYQRKTHAPTDKSRPDRHSGPVR